MLNENELAIDASRLASFRTTLNGMTQDEIDRVVANIVENTQKKFQYEIVGEITYMGHPVNVAISTAENREYVIAIMLTIPAKPDWTPVMCFHMDDIMDIANNFGLDALWNIFPIVVAHELCHYRQVLNGVIKFDTYHEADSDSVAIADNSGDVYNYEKYMQIGQWIGEQVSRRQNASKEDIAKLNDENRCRKLRALADWTKEKDLPKANDVYIEVRNIIWNLVMDALTSSDDKNWATVGLNKVQKIWGKEIPKWIYAHPAATTLIYGGMMFVIGWGAKLITKRK